MKAVHIFIFALVFATALQPGAPALAYLDPGTGSMLLQLLFGGVAGALVVGKLYWHRFMALFARSARADGSPSESGESDQSARDGQ